MKMICALWYENGEKNLSVLHVHQYIEVRQRGKKQQAIPTLYIYIFHFYLLNQTEWEEQKSFTNTHLMTWQHYYTSTSIVNDVEKEEEYFCRIRCCWFRFCQSLAGFGYLITNAQQWKHQQNGIGCKAMRMRTIIEFKNSPTEEWRLQAEKKPVKNWQRNGNISNRNFLT